MLAGFETIVPREFHEGIQRLCKRIGTGTAPCFVEVVPEADSIFSECFRNVQRKIQRDGGESQHGWIIWEAPNILVEGEFHCIWRSPGGKLLCVSARKDNEGSLAFLPDHSRSFFGRPVGHISIAWPRRKSVEKLLELEASFQRFRSQHTDPATGLERCPKSTHDWFVNEIKRARLGIK